MSACGEDNNAYNINWQICALCQTDTNEKLTKPTCIGYESLGKHIKEFYKLGELSALNECLLANVNNLKDVFSENQAVWHKTCYAKYNSTQLDRAKSRATSSTSRVSPPMTRSLQSTERNDGCIFCELPSTKSNPLSNVMKKSCNDAIIECAKILKDYKILAKVSEKCDLIALEAKYHNKCLTSYKNKKTSAERLQKTDKNEAYSNALSGVIAHINEISDKSDQEPSFRLSDLVEMQENAMKVNGCDRTINVTKFKQTLLEKCPYLTSCDKKGMPSLVIFKEDIDGKVRNASNVTHDKEGVLLQASKIVRSDLFEEKNDDSSVPQSLLTLIKLITYGHDASISESEERINLCIAELLAYHAIKRRKKGEIQKRRHDKETSAPLYLAAKIYAETRKKTLINCTYNMGLSISYKRLQKMLTVKANSICEMYHRDEVVCPPKLNRGLFTTASVDNIDHNPSSTTSKTSFHGTAITLMQHKMPEEKGLPRPAPPMSTNTEKVMQLPPHYALVPPCFSDLSKYTCTRSETCTYSGSNRSVPLIEETEWLNSTMSDDFKRWASHHALADSNGFIRHRTEVALLPLFTEQAHTSAMMAHTMDIVKKSIQFINPDQIPVLVGDQPLYALLKQLQFVIPEKYGEDKIFVMMGGLHIEMAALKVIGQWLKESGWTEALVEAQVTTQGRSESMLQATNVTRCRYAHEVTAAALYSLQNKAYELYVDENETQISLEQWRLEKSALIPQFKFWNTALYLELIVLRFVRSIRSGDFWMYVDSIRKLLPWFFALDHINYARWLSVHLKDLLNLTNNHPELLKHFEDGKFIAQKTNRKFSGMALDQAHEQMNAVIKGDGGMIGLTENPDVLRKWLVAGPELAEMIQNFEQEVLGFDSKNTADEDATHHSDTPTDKTRFTADVKSLESTLHNLGNPFLEDSLELYNIDTKTIASSEVADTIFEIEKRGEEQYVAFCDERLQTNSEKGLFEPIKLNKYPLLSSTKKREVKSNVKISGLKNDCSLFSKLYIATCEHRSGDLDTFFAHENQPCPPALSSMGKLRSGAKSDLLKVFTSMCDTATVANAPQVDVKILDGSALAHMLYPGQSKTFTDYASTTFIPFLDRELTKVCRVDLVWDTYNSESLKNVTREKRGTGKRTRVTANTKIPKGWANFLRDNNNKEELFHFLSTMCHSYEFDKSKDIYVTDGPDVLSKSTRDTQGLAPCNHEEADSRMMVHVVDAVSQGYSKIMIRTVDTDVVVLAVATVQQSPELEELWVHIGTGKNHHYICCHEIANTLGPQKAKVLPLFHAFTGCDTVSSFNNKGKKSAFEVWNAFPAATEGFLAAYEGRILDAMTIIEKFVVILYDRSSSLTSVNECRKHLFTKKDRQLENIPPTKAALHQHFLRAVFQAVHVWGQLSPTQNLPSPTDWGWTKVGDSWQPTWTDLPIAADACVEMIRCRCKKKCASRCRCLQRQLKCTELCDCDGKCTK